MEPTAGLAPVTFSDLCTLNADGWMTTPDGEQLFWVPHNQRSNLLKPDDIGVMGDEFTRFPQHFYHGTNWVNCWQAEPESGFSSAGDKLPISP